jgi:hypothetical protein
MLDIMGRRTHQYTTVASQMLSTKSYWSRNDEKKENSNGHRCKKNKMMKYQCMNNNHMWSQNDKWWKPIAQILSMGVHISYTCLSTNLSLQKGNSK